MTATMTKATKSITLLYFDGCPNVEEARRRLRTALARAGRDPVWDEVNLQAQDAPVGWRGFPSPTVLVNGKDIVTGADAADGAGGCRLGGAPTVEVIAAHLGQGKRGSWLGAVLSIPAAILGAIAAPACGACVPALAGVLSALGLGGLAINAVLQPLMAALLAVAVFGLIFQTRRSGNRWPLIPGIAGAVGIYVATFIVTSTPLKVLSIGLLVGASIWNAMPILGGRGRTKTCPSCQPQGG